MNSSRTLGTLAFVCGLAAMLGSIWLLLTPPNSDSPWPSSMWSMFQSEVTAEVSPLTFQEVVHLLDDAPGQNSTDLQRAERVKGLVGKRVLWTGWMAGARYNIFDSIGVTLYPSPGQNRKFFVNGHFAVTSFPMRYRDTFLKLNNGDKIQVDCIFFGHVQDSVVSLTECRLITPNTQEDPA